MATEISHKFSVKVRILSRCSCNRVPVTCWERNDFLVHFLVENVFFGDT